jgi:hypothetical protein
MTAGQAERSLTVKGRLAGRALIATAVGLAVSAIGAMAQSGKDLIGTWEWVSVENTRADGTRTEPFGPKPGGYLIFGADGSFFWLITRPGRARFASGRRDQGTPEENKATVQGSLAYCGIYAVSNGTLIMRIEASTYPNDEGAEQRRAYTLNGDQLSWKNPVVSTGASGIAALRRLH